MSRSFGVDPALVWLTLAGLSLRIVLTLAARNALPILDEIAYLELAEGLLLGHGYGTLFRPPLYPGFLAGWGLLVDSLQAVRVAQAILGGLCVPLVYGLARNVGGTRCARVAAGLFALDPVLAGYTSFFWSETLYIALFLGGITILMGAIEPLRPPRWLLAGLLFGLGGLARPVLLSFLPLLLPWAFWAWRQARPSGEKRPPAARWTLAFGLLTVGTCLVVLPWTARNYLATDELVLVDTNGPYNLLVSTHPEAHRVAKDDHWNQRWGLVEGVHYRDAADLDPARTQTIALETARSRIAADPLRFVDKSFYEATHLFTLDNFLLRHLRNGWYGVAPGWLLPVATGACALFSALIMLAGFVGWVSLPRSNLRNLVTLSLLHATLVFGLIYSLSRYSAPLRPLLAIGAAWLVTHLGVARDRLRGRVRFVIALGIVTLLAVAWARDVPLLQDMLTAGGAGFAFSPGP